MGGDGSKSWFQDFLDFLSAEFANFKRPSLAELATVFLGAATLIVGMGAAIYWIRAGNAGLPQVQTVSLIPQQELIVVGARQLALPTLFWTVVNVLAFSFGAAMGARQAGRGGESSGDAIPRLIWAYRGFALSVVLFWPLDWASAVLVVTLLFYALAMRHPILFSVKVAVLAAATFSFANGLAKEADAPTRFAPATLRTVDHRLIRGEYIASTGGFVYLGVDKQVRGTPSNRVASVAVGAPPADDGSRPESVMDRAVDLVGDLL